MDASNVNEENICFSSARNLFENSDKLMKIPLQRTNQSSHVHRTGFKDKNLDCKGSAVISTATLNRQQRTDQNFDDNDNNSNNNVTSISLGDRKTEISVMKINAASTKAISSTQTILKSGSSAFKTSQSKILAPFSDKNENVVKEGMIIIIATTIIIIIVIIIIIIIIDMSGFLSNICNYHYCFIYYHYLFS